MNIKGNLTVNLTLMCNLADRKTPLPAVPHLMEQLPHIDWRPQEIIRRIRSRCVVARAKKYLAGRKTKTTLRRRPVQNRDWAPFEPSDFSCEFAIIFH